MGATELANLGDPQVYGLGGPQALGAPRPGLVGLVGNPPLLGVNVQNEPEMTGTRNLSTGPTGF